MDIGHINASGFPLQIALGHKVETSRNQHHWRVRYEEHAWRHDDADEGGFIDLVFERGVANLVVECKRVRDTVWTFLVDDATQMRRRHAKSFVRLQTGQKMSAFDWSDLPVDPQSPQSQYCVIPGSDQRSRSLIERAAAELVSATEALAHEDRQLVANESTEERVYFPVIVTTALLRVCQFDASTVSLVDGTLPDGTFTDVPYVRFRKQLKTRFNALPNLHDDRSPGVARAKENTVFVVNASCLIDFLSDFDIDTSPAALRSMALQGL